MICLRHEEKDEGELNGGPDQESIKRPPPIRILVDETAYQGAYFWSTQGISRFLDIFFRCETVNDVQEKLWVQT